MSDDNSDSKKCNSEILPVGPMNSEGIVPALRFDRDSTGEDKISPVLISQDRDALESRFEPGVELSDVTIEAQSGSPAYRITHEEKVGPARVNSREYKQGWDLIFGGKQKPGQA